MFNFIYVWYERIAISEKIIGHAGKHDEFCFNAHSEQGRRAGFDAGYNTQGVGQSGEVC